MALLEVDLGDGQVVKLVNSSTRQAAPFTFRAHRVPAKRLVKLEADPALEAFNFEILKDDEPVTLAETCLRILPSRSVDGQGGRGKWATFIITARDSAGVALRVLGHCQEPAYLTDKENNFAAAPSCDDPASRWFFQPVPVDRPFDSFNLAEEEYTAFARDGFVILKNVVPPNLVDDALMFVNNFMGKGPSAWVVDADATTESGEGPKMRLPPSSHPSVMQLVTGTCIHAAAERLLGSGRVVVPGSGALAIRFPVTDRLERFGDKLTEASYKVVHRDDSTAQFHIDGAGKESPLPFSLLCKVALSDQTALHCGNFTVFPGSHRNPEVIHWYFAQMGKKPVPAPVRPAVGEPLQVRLAVGDAVLVHPYLCHRIGTNTSPHVRYSVIFRFRSKDFATIVSDQEKLLENPMLDFPWFCPDVGFAADDQEDNVNQRKTST